MSTQINTDGSNKSHSGVKQPPYFSLSPISDKNKHKVYCDALEWAISNREGKNIKNIALSGNYGSGKSSIIKTFQEREIPDLHFLKISLATFSEEKKSKLIFGDVEKEDLSNLEKQKSQTDIQTPNSFTESRNTESVNEQLRLIELSILQQIFYHEKNETIPDSRFIKVRSLTPDQIKKVTKFIFLLVCISFTLFNFNKVIKFSNLPEPLLAFEVLMKIILTVTFLYLFYKVLNVLIKFSQKLTLSKFRFQNLEIQVSNTTDKSILNNHLDEILYFFEVTKYNVVIIEDLDRFEQTEIFTKLREINLLINNAKQIDRNVVFIYAIRDEMFTNNERTKFFDFIIPVIPIINHSNSNEQLTKSLSNFDYIISNDLIDRVSYFIDDMRLLYNIVNEFHLYYQKLEMKQFKDKLFAIIVYKNIHPDDFVSLGRNKGELYKNLIIKKEIWIADEIKRINIINENLSARIENLNNSYIKNIQELKSIYLLEYPKRIIGFKHFLFEGDPYTVEKMLLLENFDKLFTPDVHCTFQSSTNIAVPIQFTEVEKSVDQKQSYLQRRETIKDQTTDGLHTLRAEIKKNEDRIRRVKNYKIAKLLKSKAISTVSIPSKQLQLILLLLRSGYIAEDYLTYISYFYPGSITERDRWFFVNVMNETKTDYKYKLDQVGNVIDKISDAEFEKNYILNFNILDQLFKNKNQQIKKDFLFDQLSNESKESTEFIKMYLDEGSNVIQFIIELSNVYNNIWNFIDNDDTIEYSNKIKFYRLILNHSSIADLVKIASQSNLISFINDRDDALSFIEKSERLYEIIDALNLKFTSLKTESIDQAIIERIYKGNNYSINTSMVSLMIQHFGEQDRIMYEASNYSAIINSKCNPLIKYLDENISTYIENIYLKLPNNKEESSESLVQLINHKDIDLKDKERVILYSNTRIPYIGDLESSHDLFDFVLKGKKIEPSWSTILYVFENSSNIFTSVLTEFLNDRKVADTLIANTFELNSLDDIDFEKSFILNKDINDEMYSLYMPCLKFIHEELPIEKLSKSKIISIIEFKKLKFNKENYLQIHNIYNGLHIDFIIKNFSKFLEDYCSFDIDEVTFNKLLQNIFLQTDKKSELIENFQNNNKIKSDSTLNLVATHSLNNPSLNINKETLTSLLLRESIDADVRIKLFMRDDTIFRKWNISDFLISLGGNYKKLNEYGPMPTFEKSEHLQNFFNFLKNQNKISKSIVSGERITVTTFRAKV